MTLSYTLKYVYVPLCTNMSHVLWTLAFPICYASSMYLPIKNIVTQVWKIVEWDVESLGKATKKQGATYCMATTYWATVQWSWSNTASSFQAAFPPLLPVDACRWRQNYSAGKRWWNSFEPVSLATFLWTLTVNHCVLDNLADFLFPLVSVYVAWSSTIIWLRQQTSS